MTGLFRIKSPTLPILGCLNQLEFPYPLVKQHNYGTSPCPGKSLESRPRSSYGHLSLPFRVDKSHMFHPSWGTPKRSMGTADICRQPRPTGLPAFLRDISDWISCWDERGISRPDDEVDIVGVICVYICIYIYVWYIYIYDMYMVYIYIYIYIYAFVFVYVNVYMCICMCMCMYM